MLSPLSSLLYAPGGGAGRLSARLGTVFKRFVHSSLFALTAQKLLAQHIP
jgi:hypothetical protein